MASERNSRGQPAARGSARHPEGQGAVRATKWAAGRGSAPGVPRATAVVDVIGLTPGERRREDVFRPVARGGDQAADLQ